MTRSCLVCGTPTKKTCTGCSNAAYCSRTCQAEDWISHIVDCDIPGRELTTADHLAASVFKQDSTFMKGETARDYGYYRVLGGPEESKILDAIWMEIILTIGVKPLTLHKWRVEGRLHAELVATYGRTSKRISDVNFAWLREHPEVFDPKGKSISIEENAHEVRLAAWRFIGGSESDSLADMKRKSKDWPTYKHSCFHFYGMVVADGGPSIGNSVPWVRFGFCVFNTRKGIPLRQLYRDLVEKCTFDEFCEAYKKSRLIELIDSKGLKAQRMQMPEHFETVLSQSPDYVATIWFLRAYITAQNEALPDPVILMPYGYANCRDKSELTRLTRFYAKVLKEWVIPPLELHNAAVRDQIYEYLSQLPVFESTTAERRFLKRVLKTQNWWLFGGSSSTATQWIQLSAFVDLMLLHHLTN
ncbi:hypothetical protein SISNIDRAFT_492183 [Sistotremastrum niveocremeum HHB9708]|uniref:MYND-type domain-containing protein n=1 Tax=Sistotremastrum niveocremeum HHB9708 TaxID=1314777 RepID=A0A165ACZ8_9AGAM|nr:hypothetical protein SISNIDRAFT_492183 [Sistotremastrum niveocremeum HHB9708]